MTSPRTLGLLLLTAWTLGATALAQTPSELRADFRAGQTFVTWRELPQPGIHYRVYRAELPILDAATLHAADFLGEVDDRSSRNKGRSLASGNESTWVIQDGAAPLDFDQGLFVHNVEHGTRYAYYAVTSVNLGVEDETLLSGVNTLARPTKEPPG